ncbi:hypothetical protein ACLOJK_009784 [Asimina triloba]
MAFVKMPDQPKFSKRRLSLEQLKLLESSFNYEKKIEPERKGQLARDLGLHPRQVAIWYQNKRARWKTHSLKHDYQALQIRVDCVLSEKRLLDKEVKRLRRELEKAHKMLHQCHSPHTTLSLSCEEEWNSSLHSDGNWSLEHAGSMQLEELYASYTGVDDQLMTFN